MTEPATDTVRIIPPLDLDHALIERLRQAATDINLAGDGIYNAVRRGWDVCNEVTAAVERHPMYGIDDFMRIVPGYDDIYNAVIKVARIFDEWEKLDADWSFWTDEVQA